jgi:hypothetical protein
MGAQSNTFRCFITQAFCHSVPEGVFAFIHDDGLFTDPSARNLRREMYKRLRYWFQFGNDLPIFPALSGRGNTWFEISVCGSRQDGNSFQAICDVLHPRTIDESIVHDGSGPVDGRKTPDNKWNLNGHKSRMLTVDDAALALFAQVLGSERSDAAEDAPLLSIYSRELIAALQRLAVQERKIGNLPDKEVTGSRMWDEAGAVENKIIYSHPGFPLDTNGLILSGSHYSVACSTFKSARRICTEKCASSEGWHDQWVQVPPG